MRSGAAAHGVEAEAVPMEAVGFNNCIGYYGCVRPLV